jgi:hypothetical protein
MSDIGQVVAQMAAVGLPMLPPNHPVLDGKYKRFGPQKKAWYILREMTLRSGRRVVTGAFGIFQGENRNTVPVTIDFSAMSEEERADLAAKQKAQEAREADDRARQAQLAANRARDQWQGAAVDDIDHPYLARKQITAEGVRLGAKGLLLIPMIRGGHMVGLQKIDAAGAKLYNKGMDKIGAACVLGQLAGAQVIGVGEGYATCRSVRMAAALVGLEFPVVAAFDAGNLQHVAQTLRKLYPAALLVFLVDDDYLQEARFIERLASDFNVHAMVPVDGATHTVRADDGEDVHATATWRVDAHGIPYIEADVRKGRRIQMLKYENAGVSRSTAAAALVGNAVLAKPLFADRAGRKLTDWNDLHVEQSLDVVAAQIVSFLPAAKQPDSASSPFLAAQAAQALPALAGIDPTDPPLPLAAEQPAAFPILPSDAAQAVAPVLPAVAGTDPHDPPLPPAAEQPAAWPANGAGEIEISSDETLQAAVQAFRDAPEGPPTGEEKPSPAGAEGEGVRAKEKPKKVYGDEHWQQVNYVLKNFILIYGEDLVWDCSQRMLMKISAMRTIVQNSDVMKFWGGPARRWVLKKNIVFDPSEVPSPEESGPTATVNLFNGWKMQPKPGDCTKILVLLLHLCNGDHDLATWIQRWLAYPLRNRGAKMESSIIMHGDEGSGKNFFFEKVVKKIYGEYGYVIGNAQLEAQFNEWASRKLFMVADEVVTRSELRHMKGKLKYLITGESIIINPKGLPEYSEANHMNFVFLSNELQPLALDKTDRRYLVIWTPPALPREFYVEVAQEIDQGGVEAFYHYLLHELDMDDFDRHTKPLYTDAKDDLIEKSLTPAERFYREWSRGYLPLPFMTCGATQLYEAFKTWCDKSGEGRYISQTLFSPTVTRYAAGAIEKRVVKFPFASVAKQRNVFLVGEKPPEKSLADWVEASADLFEKDLKEYRRRPSSNVEG